MRPEFTAMRAKYGYMFLRVQHVIEKCQPSIDELKRYLQYIYPDLDSRLHLCTSIDNVLSLVQEKCSLINTKLLEAMIKGFEFKEAEEYINTYKEEVARFCQGISVRLCLYELSLKYTELPLRVPTVTFILDWNPDEYMLDDIRQLLCIAFEILNMIVRVVVIKESD